MTIVFDFVNRVVLVDGKPCTGPIVLQGTPSPPRLDADP